MLIAAGGALVAVKRKTLNRSIKVRTYLYNPSREGADHGSDHALLESTRSKKVMVAYMYV
jgi:hypothetical protein